MSGSASWTEVIFQAVEKMEPKNEPLFPDDLPSWVQNIYIELFKTFYPATRSHSKRNAASLGAFLGRHYAWAALFQGQIPLSPKIEKQFEEAEQKLPQLKKKEAQNFARDLTRQQRHFQRLLAKAFLTASQQPYSESLAFIQAFSKNAQIQVDDLEHMMSRSERIYFILLMIRPHVQKFKSLAALHRFLAPLVPYLGDFKSFEKLCQKIGLKLAPPGRPRGIIQKN